MAASSSYRRVPVLGNVVLARIAGGTHTKCST
jgi:hypothetical protein